MKKDVKFSTYSIVLSILTFFLVVGIFIWQYNKTGLDVLVWVLFALIVIWGFFCLYYSPLSLELTDSSLNVNRCLRIKEIPLSEISSVKLTSPTMGERRISGSGGFLGYWGWFSERDLGKYFAYYGKASDCFLVSLKNGKKYMLGCKDAPLMVEAINKAIS